MVEGNRDTQTWGFVLLCCTYIKIAVYLLIIYSCLLLLLITTRKTMYVHPNREALSCNYCCNGKAMNITHPEFVYL